LALALPSAARSAYCFILSIGATTYPQIWEKTLRLVRAAKGAGTRAITPPARASLPALLAHREGCEVLFPREDAEFPAWAGLHRGRVRAEEGWRSCDKAAA